MFPKTNFDVQIARAQKALEAPSTRKPSPPKDRTPQMRQSPAKTHSCFGTGAARARPATAEQRAAQDLHTSVLAMMGSYLENASKASSLTRAQLRNFIGNMEICLKLRDGKLNLDQYSKLVIMLDEIAHFIPGELRPNLKTIDGILRDYESQLL